MRAKSDWRSTRYLAAQERSKLKRRLRNEQHKRLLAEIALAEIAQGDKQPWPEWSDYQRRMAGEWAWWL